MRLRFQRLRLLAAAVVLAACCCGGRRLAGAVVASVAGFRYLAGGLLLPLLGFVPTTCKARTAETKTQSKQTERFEGDSNHAGRRGHVCRK